MNQTMGATKKISMDTPGNIPTPGALLQETSLATPESTANSLTASCVNSLTASCVFMCTMTTCTNVQGAIATTRVNPDSYTAMNFNLTRVLL